MLPIQYPTSSFSRDQRSKTKVSYWDTTCTVPQTGITVALFDLLDWSVDLLSTSLSTKTAIEAMLNNASKVRSVLGTTGGAYRTGLEPNIVKYWGTGTFPGGKISQRVVLKYSGTVVADDVAAHPVTLVFGGYGKIRAFKNGTEIVNGVIREPLTHAVPDTDLNTIEREAGYQIVETSVTAGDLIDIYYVQNGEPWGGFFAKVIPQQGLTTSWTAFRTALMNAGIVSASFIAAATAVEQNVPYVIHTEVQAGVQQIRQATVEVALNDAGRRNGFLLENVGGMNQLTDNGDGSLVIRPGRRIYCEGGFARQTADEMYPRFTGRVVSITPSADEATATILCQGFENRLDGEIDESYPDPISYLANGLIDREWLGYPVFGVQAFDAWPMEVAIAHLNARAGVDSYNLGKSPYAVTPTYGRWTYITFTGQVVYLGQKRFSARALSDSAQFVYLQRNTNYGNVGVLQKDYLRKDDPYIFPSRVSDRVYDRVSLLASQYGYDFFFDAQGQATIRSRNNPQSWQYLSLNGDATQYTNPSAIGGRYYRDITGVGATGWSKQFTAFCSRVDLYVGLGIEALTTANGGRFAALVEVHDGVTWRTIQNTTISTYRAGATESFFYDDVLLQNGTNASVVTLFSLPFDEYRVTITPAGVDLADVATTAAIRLNGVAIFERDPNTSCYPQNLSTLSNVMELKPVSNEKDMRNQVIVVGQRKATVTDSDKFQADDNPNNPFTEFYVSVAADPLSIYDPTATNFLGGKKVVVIVDEKVTDGDFAKWLARTVLFRSNMPTNSAEITTTPLPMIEIRDAIRVVNEKQDNIPTTVWVESFRERWPAEGDAEVEITLTAYQELPSYTPREDLDISLFQNSPAFRISASYKNIYGNTVSNPAMPTTMPVMSRNTTAVTNATSMTLPTSWAPDDLHLQHSTFTGNKKYLINHPYRHFYHISNISGSGATRTYTTTFDFQEGDGTASVYDKTYYGFITNWSISGDAYVDRSAGAGTSATINPFYDPYSSEVNNLVSLKFDTLVSGFYRVSLWAATNKGEYDFPVAWLTKPEGDAEDVEAHWAYMEAGAGRELLWDGVDNVGLWNRYQTADYARIHDGSFLDKPVAVGKGFYTQNDQSTDIQTQIGDQVSTNYDTSGMPFFVKGRYSRFYLKIEAKSDRLTRASSSQTIFEVNSHNQLKVISTPFYIFTHLGEPSQSTLAIEEWDDTVDKWVQGTVINHWSTINQASGNPEIRHGKPVRVSFTPIARRGVLFFNEAGVADNDRWSGQLTRVAHMKVNTFDQFWTFYGVPWEGDINEKNKSYNNASNQEAKRLTNRMNSDDTHTVTFESDAWLTGKDMKAFQWIFHPDFFKKDFGGGFDEAIRYGDYEQLYSLPGYDYKQGGGTARKDKAFINMAFMNYLFYLSAMTMDRSGRRQWCTNPNFVDKSKIVSSTWLAATQASNPAYALQYERFGAANYLQRSVFVRQWVEPTWKVSSGGFLSGSPVDPAHLGTTGISNSFQLQWVQPSVLDFDPTTSPMASTGTEDMWMTAYTTQNSQVMKDFWLQATSFLGLQVRPFYAGMPSHTHNYAVTTFGAWGFDRYIYTGWFKPSPCRDFHPYWREPGMPDWATAWPGYTLDTIDAPNVGVNIMEAPASHYGSAMRDIAAQANWFGFAYSDSFNAGTAGSNLNWRGARLEEDVIAWAKQGNKFTEFANVFDYVKQDTLNRFDHYRGVISRSPLAKRTAINAANDLDWWKSSESRQAGAQATSPSGMYLMNLGNYNDYVTAPCTSKQYRENANFMHFTHDINKFYDIRFRHEYVWQNSRYFPVYPNGGAKYWAFQSERHGLAANTGVDLYDAGAWTGWKDDITSAAWSGDSHLKWSELFGATGTNTNQANVWNDGTSSTKPFYSGGYGVNSVGGALAATGAISYQQKVMGTNSNSIKWFKRANIFADEFGSSRMRLAVGPRTPETRSLTMNLVLPYRLSH